MESTWKKKKGEQTKKGELNSLTFQTHLSFTLYTHTHTTKKHFKSCPNLCKLLAECVFLFVFFSLRIVTLTGTRRARILFSEKMGIIIAACVGDDCIKIDRFKKKRNLNPHSTTLYLSKRVQNRSKRIPRSVFRTFRMDLLGIRFRATQYARGKDGIVRKRRFFVFRECNPRQHLEARLDTFFQKKKKRTDPFTSSFSHTKNIIYDS